MGKGTYCLLNDSFPPLIDGVANVVMNYAKHIVANKNNAIVITPDHPDVRELGFAVKLDTNGYRPDVLRSLIDEGLLDYVAMDIKNSPEKYGATVGLPEFDISPILESIDILKGSGVPFEFRTTVIRELHTEEDIRAIGQWLSFAKRFYLQSFTDSGDLLGEGLSAHSIDTMEHFLKILKESVPNAALRS